VIENSTGFTTWRGKVETGVSKNLTDLLVRWGDGSREAFDALVPQVYGELHRVARNRLRSERNGHTLQPTALTHEAFLRLFDQKRVQWQNRDHFFALAAEMMRRILVEHARKRHAAKRGGNDEPITLDEARDGETPPIDVDVLALHEALERLEDMDPRQGRIVELRYFGGFSVEETARILELSPATIKREWKVARLWLHHELKGT